ncbi:MAG: STAS domain-containing protein [Chitinivibrionales bacterium]
MILSFKKQKDRLTIFLAEKGHWTPSTFFPQLDSAVEKVRFEFEKSSQEAVVFDLSSLKSMDSSVISLVIQTVRLARNKRVCVLATHEDVFNMLMLLGIDELAHVYSSESTMNEEI